MFYLDRLPGPVLVTDCNGRIKHANSDFRRLAGAASAAEMDQFFPPASRIFLQTHAWPLLLRNGEFSEIYLQLRAASGQSIPVMTNARISEVDGGAEVIWLFFVAEDRQRFEAELLKARQQAQESAAQLAKVNLALQGAYAQLADYAVEIKSEAEQLAQLSHTDPLTALGNRRALSLHVEQWIGSVSDHACASLLLIDIDHFKQINDRFGHEVGDRALIHFATVLAQRLRINDLFCRLGGEEFAVLLPGSAAEQARDIAESLRERLAAEPLRFDDIALPMTLSAGVASFRADGQSLDELMLAADRRTYAAKRAGRNRVITQEDVGGSEAVPG